MVLSMRSHNHRERADTLTSGGLKCQHNWSKSPKAHYPALATQSGISSE